MKPRRILDPVEDDDLEYVCECGHGVLTHVEHGPCESCACAAFKVAGIRNNGLGGLAQALAGRGDIVVLVPREDASVDHGVPR